MKVSKYYKSFLINLENFEALYFFKSMNAVSLLKSKREKLDISSEEPIDIDKENDKENQVRKSILKNNNIRFEKNKIENKIEKTSNFNKSNNTLERFAKNLNDLSKGLAPLFEKLSKFENTFLKISETLKPFQQFLSEYNKRISRISFEDFLDIEIQLFLLYLFSEFENYTFKVIKYLFIKKPILLSDKKIQISELIENNDLNLHDIDEKVPIDLKYLIDKKAESVIQKKFNEEYFKIFEFIKEQFNINHNLSKKEFSDLNFYKQIRDLYAHRDGTVDHKFIKNNEKKIIKLSSKFNIKLGKKLVLTYSQLRDGLKIARDILVKFDKTLIKTNTELIVDLI